MYKRQLEEQESISNSNIMRVKKFQRELEAAESRAEEAESSLNAFRSQQRVFAAAAESRSREVNDVEREVVVKKTVTNVNRSNVNNSSTAINQSSSQNISSSSSNQLQSSSNAAAMMSSSQNYRAGSTMAYSWAGSMSRASMTRGASVG